MTSRLQARAVATLTLLARTLRWPSSQVYILTQRGCKGMSRYGVQAVGRGPESLQSKVKEARLFGCVLLSSGQCLF